MCDRQHAARRVYHRHRLVHLEALLLQVSRLAGAEERVEGGGDGSGVALLHERARNVRAPEGAAGSELLDALQADVAAEMAEALDHRQAAALARLAEVAQARVDPLVERIEGVGEDVHGEGAVAAGEARGG